MRIAAAAASRDTVDNLITRLLSNIRQQLHGERPNLGIVFATNHHEDDMLRVSDRIREETKVEALIGCTAESVIGPGREYEQEPALSLWLASLPDVRVRAFHVTQIALETLRKPDEWTAEFMIAPNERPTLLMLGDPFSIETTFLSGLNANLPGCRVVGGMASGADDPGQNVLIEDHLPHRGGAVGVTLSGPIAIDTVVSQGCRPIGKPFVITKAEANVIHELGGRKPLAVLQEIYAESSTTDQRLMNQGLFLGRAINERQEKFERGDFLIRNLAGVNEETGAIAIQDLVRVGITVQFHVRDAASADEDLRALLANQATKPHAGALLFSCNGRGRRMFPQRDHDVTALSTAIGPVPVGGFFCAGEFGPVGGKNFIHGHTASVALFRDA